MPKAQDYYPECPEAFLVSLARTGNRSAFEELVRRRQSSIRNLMRRCCNDYTLADDLAQQVFLKVWLNIRKLRKISAFSAWLIFAIPLLEFAVLISQGLTMLLVDLGEGWLALVFLPVNNIASLLVITVKVVLMARKKIIGASVAK